jgi:hypothetical protein
MTSMKSSNRLPGKTGFQWAGIALGLAIVGVGFASEQIYQHDDSIAIIRQSGGSGPSESQVIRHEDGHTIITQDGRNTDITIQRRDPAPPGKELPVNGEERFGKW